MKCRDAHCRAAPGHSYGLDEPQVAHTVLAVIVHAELTCAPLLWAAQSCPTHRTPSWAPHAAGCAEGGPRPTCPSAAFPEENFAHLSQENRDQPSGCESRVLLRAVGPSSPRAVICSAHQHQLMAGPDLPISVTQHIQHSHACSSPLPCPGPFLSDCPPGSHPYTAAQPKLHLSTQLLRSEAVCLSCQVQAHLATGPQGVCFPVARIVLPRRDTHIAADRGWCAEQWEHKQLTRGPSATFCLLSESKLSSWLAAGTQPVSCCVPGLQCKALGTVPSGQQCCVTVLAQGNSYALTPILTQVKEGKLLKNRMP